MSRQDSGTQERDAMQKNNKVCHDPLTDMDGGPATPDKDFLA